MAGIYIHIPFCRSRCAYCDFFSTTREAEIDHYVDALCSEIEARSTELPLAHIHTIYIGGGTPSLLTHEQLLRILNTVYAFYTVDADAEVTMEMNPDDAVDFAQLHEINRISLGIQTFDDNILRLIRRRHDSATAIQTVKSLQAAGFDNISIDLIYGLPGQTLEQWQLDLDTAFSLGIQHLSAYALSYEPGTPLTRLRDAGQVHEAPDELSVAMYERLCKRAHEAGFEHYEISNFALPHHHSRHNSSYWTGEPYLGFGPAAHSYDGHATRQANLPSLDEYCTFFSSPWGGLEGAGPFTTEHLTTTDLIDETVMCGLRTASGIDLEAFKQRFGQQCLDTLLRAAAPHLASHRLILSSDHHDKPSHLRLTEQAWMVADDVMSDLMSEES